ncbi:hypothetical protein CH92_00275 [Stutzerimonas stutzeri]|uniref:Uncharacterized protein n=1 Tax=Stutzerimonas stutzeri TaxID=316 RepID=W8R4P2_STUST|nr:hypothetical protein [Stutzerimonas stutzeri]AHL77594.1 hypothetical protein CH92_00275 [Stutzerimonas stutzeri]MCQ4328874.1 hypothetical protein [Stutzerimonas stutzeri]
MADAIQINTERLKNTLDQIRLNRSEALTIDIIEQYMGGFHQNKAVPPTDSWNAQFGKYLKAHHAELGVREIAAGQKVKVNGSLTSSSLWALNHQPAE